MEKFFCCRMALDGGGPIISNFFGAMVSAVFILFFNIKYKEFNYKSMKTSTNENMSNMTKNMLKSKAYRISTQLNREKAMTWREI